MLKLVNTDRNVSIEIAGLEPRDIMGQIANQGATGSIGLISLRSLLSGAVEEVSGYTVVEFDDVVGEETAAETEEVVATEVAVELKVAEEVAVEEVAVELKVEVVESAEVEEVAVELTAEQKKAASDAALKKAFGVDVKAGREDGGFNSAQKTNEVKRPRRDLQALINKAVAGKHAKLLELSVAAGYSISNVENTERWFGLTAPTFGTDRNAPRFDVSPLKTGAFSVSLYINDRATGLKVKVVPETTDTPEMSAAKVVECMNSDTFKDAISAYTPAV